MTYPLALYEQMFYNDSVTPMESDPHPNSVPYGECDTLLPEPSVFRLTAPLFFRSG
jgi:hypothetical protein